MFLLPFKKKPAYGELALIIAKHIEHKNTPQMKVKNHNTDSTKYNNRKMYNHRY